MLWVPSPIQRVTRPEWYLHVSPRIALSYMSRAILWEPRETELSAEQIPNASIAFILPGSYRPDWLQRLGARDASSRAKRLLEAGRGRVHNSGNPPERFRREATPADARRPVRQSDRGQFQRESWRPPRAKSAQ